MTEQMYPVALTTPTMMVLERAVQQVPLPANASAAIGAAIVRGNVRPGTNNLIFDTSLTREEIAPLWAVLHTFMEGDPQAHAGPTVQSQREATMLAAAVESDMDTLIEARKQADAAVAQPKRSYEGGWRRFRR